MFTNLRDSVTEIIDSLKRHAGCIDARYFIGQVGGAPWTGILQFWYTLYRSAA